MNKKKIIIIISFTTGIINPLGYTKTTTIDKLTDDDYREELINVINSAFEISTKKLHNFVDKYKSNVDSKYEVEESMLIRHFFLETLEEVNNNLRKNDKQYGINFSYEMLFNFADEDKKCLEENKLLNDDESINENKLNLHLDCTEKAVTTYSSTKKLYIKPVHVDEHLLSIFL